MRRMMLEINNKMILKWKINLMEKCIQRKNLRKEIKTNREKRKKLMRKWVMLIKIKKKKI